MAGLTPTGATSFSTPSTNNGIEALGGLQYSWGFLDILEMRFFSIDKIMRFGRNPENLRWDFFSLEKMMRFGRRRQ